MADATSINFKNGQNDDRNKKDVLVKRGESGAANLIEEVEAASIRTPLISDFIKKEQNTSLTRIESVKVKDQGILDVP